MNRRVLSFGVLLAVFAFVLLGIQGSNAGQDGGNTRRFRTVEIEVLQYVWELVSNRDGRVICQVINERPTRPTNDEAITICGEQIFPAETIPSPLTTLTPAPTSTPGPTPTPFDLAEFFSGVSWRLAGTQQIIRTVNVPLPDIIVNLVTPTRPVDPYFVTIYAYEPVEGEQITGIFGTLNGWAFTCPSARCDILIEESSVLEFWATSSYGDESQHYQATFSEIVTQEGQTMELTSLTPVTLFQDACSVIWGSTRVQPPSWALFPPLPTDLNTMKPYQYLAGKLIVSGVVNASGCPGNGLLYGETPNACGLDRASTAVIDWQNQFDLVIWDAARRIGIPPVVIKTLIEQESQFWPGNAIRAPYEYGLGQLSQVGADVALRWDNELFTSICNGLLFDCTTAYGKLPTWLQATVRGGLLRAMDAECATCPHGIDLVRARESVPTLARMLRASCRQVKYIMDVSGMNASYEDLWRFTVLSYHSGYQCLADALDYVEFNALPVTWDNVSPYLSCTGAASYVDNFWKSLDEFETYRIKRPESIRPVVQPTFAVTPPVPTVTPTATPVLAMSHIRVLVYVDSNANNFPEENEKVDGVAVEVAFPDGTVVNATTVNGEANIDLTGRPVGIDVTVSLPSLFRSQRVRVMRDGEIPVVFRLEEPVVPPVLP